MANSKETSHTTALMLSAFVMPGSGQILLGNKIKGYAIASATCIFIFAPFVRFFFSMAAKLASHAAGTPEDVFSAVAFAWHANKGLIVVSIFAIVILWLYGILDIAMGKPKKRT